MIDVATTSHPPSYIDELRDEHDLLRSLGQSVTWLEQDAMRSEVNSPTYVGGLFRTNRAATVDPAKLAWELKRVAEELGVRIYEHSKATSIDKDGAGMLVTTPLGNVRCAKVVLGTNADRPLLKRLRQYMIPVYDYCLVTEPLTPAQLASVGWAHRQGLSDITNQFHYYRLTPDNRILWGGYDAIYYWGSKVSADLESRPETWAKLSSHFFQTFPQLEDVNVLARLGRRHRHEHPLLGVLRDGDVRSRRVCARLHRPRRRRDAVRRRRDARPAERPALDRHADRLRQEATAAVPAGAVPVRRDPGDTVVDGPRGQDRQAQCLAALARPARPRFRLLITR